MNNKENPLLKLIEDENDTYQDLKYKNKKLREIIIKITEELKTLSMKYNSMQKEFTAEKQMLLDKLDKITNNYKLYAEGYKEKAILKKDIGTLISNYKQNNKVLNSFKEWFSFLLKKNIVIYNECKNFDIDKYNNNTYNTTSNTNNTNGNNSQYENFILDIKNHLFNNIIQFRKNIDMINFPDFYKEYLSFVEREEKERKEMSKFFDKTKYKKISKEREKSNTKSKSNSKFVKGKKGFGNCHNHYSFTKINLNNDFNNNNILSDKDWNNNFEQNEQDIIYKGTNFYNNYALNMDNKIYKKRKNNSSFHNFSQYGNA